MRNAPPAIVSQWDWDNLRYDYWRVPGTVSLGGWGRLAGLGTETSAGAADNKVGVDIESVLPPLPVGAVRVGSGVAAVGRVVRPSRRPRYETQGASPAGLAAAPTYLPLEVQTALESPEVRALKERIGYHAMGAFVLGLTVGYLVPKVKWVALGTAAVATLLAGFGAGRDAR